MKHKHFFLLALAMLASFTYSFAQPQLSLKKRVKVAKELFDEGKYYQAAEYYKSAYDEKKTPEYAFKAAEGYFLVRDYANAAKYYEPVKEMNKDFDKPGYKYAVALKQMGEYEKARKEFKAFGLSYNGSDYKEYESVIKEEMAGCDLGMSFTAAPIEAPYEVKLLDMRINSQGAEFAPIPMDTKDAEIIYFSSNADGASKIYRAQKAATSWSLKTVPDIFKNITKPHFGNGSFSPSGNRFYFTQCDVVKGKTQCNIFVLIKNASGWSEPLKLQEDINVAGKTTTHPFVAEYEDREWLFFVSDRDGGKGGLDIWYCSRQAGKEGTNFSAPANLGSNINTIRDEVTPYYNPSTKTLYFSSNGHRNVGGFDIFSSEGEKASWDKPVNIGAPFNSSADDLYYIAKPEGSKGYFVSNRSEPPLRTSTLDDDIFSFESKDIVVKLTGYVLEEANEARLGDYTARLYTAKEGVETLYLEQVIAGKEQFNFALLPDSEYRLEITKPGFQNTGFEFTTNEFTQSETFEQDVLMKVQTEASKPVEDPHKATDFDYSNEFKEIKDENNAIVEAPGKIEEVYIEEKSSSETPKVADKAPAKTSSSKSSSKTASSSKSSSRKKETTPRLELDAPAPDGTAADAVAENVYYRIQISAVTTFKSSSFSKEANIGDLKTEKNDAGLTRIMVGDYGSVREAREALHKLKDLGRVDAFIIRYENDARMGDGFQ